LNELLGPRLVKANASDHDPLLNLVIAAIDVMGVLLAGAS